MCVVYYRGVKEAVVVCVCECLCVLFMYVCMHVLNMHIIWDHCS